MKIVTNRRDSGREFCRRARRPALHGWPPLLLSVALVLLPWLVKLDGKPHADWEQFLGRFHPLAVHLPIGFLLLVPLLEVAGRLRPALREAAGFVLGLTFASCLLALTLGVLLAYGSGDAGPGVTRHMAGGIALTIGVLALFAGAAMVVGGKRLLSLSGAARLHVCRCSCGLRTRAASLYAWKQLPDSIHAGGPEAMDSSTGRKDAAGLLLCKANQSYLRFQLRRLPWRGKSKGRLAAGFI